MKIDNYFIRMLSILRRKSVFSVIVLLLLLAGNISAQQKAFKTQGIPRPEQKIKSDNKNLSPKVKKSPTRDNTFTFDDIKFWVGEGENKAALVVDWYYDDETAMVWGFRWNGEATGLDMIKAIAKADPSFLFLTQLTNLGNTIAGLGYASSRQKIKITYDLEGVKNDPKINFKFDKPNEFLGQHSCPTNPMADIEAAIQGGMDTGIIDHPFNYAKYGYACYDYDYWKCTLPEVKWRAAWYHEGYWSYLIKDDINDEFVYSGVGATLRKLTNGSWDSWGFQKGWESWTGVEPREPFKPAPLPVTIPAKFEDITYWVGNGTKKAGVVIKWNDGKSENSLMWGYRWDGDKKVIDMLKDIARQDERLFILLNKKDSIGGIGFDIDGKNTQAVIYNNNTTYPLYPFEGLVSASNSDFDKYAAMDNADYWNAGIVQKGIWRYFKQEKGEKYLLESVESIQNKTLTENSWNALNFDKEFKGAVWGNFTPVTEYKHETVDYTKGMFVVNEEWFGHTNGSVNFMKENGEWIYRAYTRENPRQAFGATTQFGTIYGDNFYFVSKQAADGGDKQYTPGGRLVIADVKTLKKKANFDVLGEAGDGRSFLGVDEQTGYIGTAKGIVLFNIDKMTIGNVIEGTTKGQIGTMLRIGDYVFACMQGKGVLVINATNHTIVKTIECTNIGSIVSSKDGYLWASAYGDGLWKINPYTLAVEKKIAIPESARIPGTWGAWNSGVMAASEKTNSIFWAKMQGSASMTYFGTKVFKYDIDKDDVNSTDFLSKPFYELKGYDGKEAFYGSAININPANNELVITSTRTGYGANYQKNRVHVIDAETAEVKNIYELNDYYWFPAMSVFPDNASPVIAEALKDTIIDGDTKIYLGDKVSDADNYDKRITKSIAALSDQSLCSISIRNDSLVILPIKGKYGSVDVDIKFNSNGKIATKKIKITINNPSTGIDNTNSDLSISYNPTTGTIHIKSDTEGRAIIYGIGGNAVMSVTVNRGENSIQASHLAQGVYIVRFMDKSVKIIKQ